MKINFLRKIRESLLLSKAKVAKKANISPKTVARIEKGLPCREETKQKILLALGYKDSYKNEAMTAVVIENENNRLGLERRQFSYDKHIPERRSGMDRRSGLDRIQKPRESELRKNNEPKEQSKTESNIGDVIRRRKGKPDKRIYRKLNLQ